MVLRSSVPCSSICLVQVTCRTQSIWTFSHDWHTGNLAPSRSQAVLPGRALGFFQSIQVAMKSVIVGVPLRDSDSREYNRGHRRGSHRAIVWALVGSCMNQYIPGVFHYKPIYTHFYLTPFELSVTFYNQGLLNSHTAWFWIRSVIR